MITFSNLGGLGRFGNQLFQVAAVIGTAVKNSTSYALPFWKYQMVFKNILTLNTKKLKQYREEGFQFNEITGDNLDLYGYFQSLRYFEHCEDLIRHYFTFTAGIEKFTTIYSDYYTDDYCAIHVRRGDYVNNDFHNLLPMQYFINAMEHFKGKKFVVFSDDIKWCRENFKDCEFICNNEIQDFAVMANFKNHIISNSSFSWWASWLAKSTKTVAPKEWFGNGLKHLDTKDLYLKNWIIESSCNTVPL